MVYKLSIIRRLDPKAKATSWENNFAILLPKNIEILVDKRAIVKIIKLLIPLILDCFIPYVTPKLKASILTDIANKTQCNIFLSNKSFLPIIFNRLFTSIKIC